ncbi:MAG: gluconate 2-dehydrogenase subunit 3 family protein [Dongiaceae bacterium]
MQSRRRLLEAAARFGGLAWLAGLAGIVWRGRRAEAAADERTFDAYLDTLIPDEASAPGALRLGIRAQVAAGIGDTGLIEQFCRWLDDRARAAGGRSFAGLAADAREAIVAAAEAAAPDTLPARAFRRTRHEAFAHYYADARSWPAVGYRGPPQPEGFPDYAQPPQDER